MDDLRGYKATDPITITELRTCEGQCCRHAGTLFRSWVACCRCDRAQRRFGPDQPEFEEKTHGFVGCGTGPHYPLLTAIDRKVVAWANREGAEETEDRFVVGDAYDLAAYVRALDRKLALPEPPKAGSIRIFQAKP